MSLDVKRAARRASEAAQETTTRNSKRTLQLHWRQEGAPLVPMTNGRRIRERAIAECPASEVWWMAEHHLRDATFASGTDSTQWFRMKLDRYEGVCREAMLMPTKKAQQARLRRGCLHCAIWRYPADLRQLVASRLVPGLTAANKAFPAIFGAEYVDRIHHLLARIDRLDAETKGVPLEELRLLPWRELLTPILSGIDDLVSDILNEEHRRNGRAGTLP